MRKKESIIQGERHIICQSIIKGIRRRFSQCNNKLWSEKKVKKLVELCGNREIDVLCEDIPMELISRFPEFRIDPGYVLKAYIHRSSHCGFWTLFAWPENHSLPETLRLGNLFSLPEESRAFTDVISFSPSPENFMSASIFYREMNHFADFWHGNSWGRSVVLYEDPWKSCSEKNQYFLDLNHFEADGTWEWEEARPESWSPSVTISEVHAVVKFYTYNDIAPTQICFYEDIYELSGRFQSLITMMQERGHEIATGPGGIMF